MSQLVGNVKELDLSNGYTLCMVVEIRATLQNRRKVIYEYADKSKKSILKIQLNELDFLSLIIHDSEGSSLETKLISPNKFAAYYINRPCSANAERPVFIAIRISPILEKEDCEGGDVNIDIFIDDKKEASTKGYLNLEKYYDCFSSMGSALDGSDAATIRIGELIEYEKSVKDEDLFKLRDYVSEKWGVGPENERLNKLISDIKINSTLLLVEDQYTQIYKVAWLKLNDIEFNQENIEDIFLEYADFTVLGAHGVGGVAGYLRAKNPELIDKHLVGLFDFDAKGSESFYLLGKEEYWKGGNKGAKDSGIYKKRSDHPCCYALLLPVPERLSNLADLEYANFSSYIEIENLLPEKFLLDNNFVDTKKISGGSYFKIKDKYKSSLWKRAIALEKKDFSDFRSLFETFKSLVNAG